MTALHRDKGEEGMAKHVPHRMKAQEGPGSVREPGPCRSQVRARLPGLQPGPGSHTENAGCGKHGLLQLCNIGERGVGRSRSAMIEPCPGWPRATSRGAGPAPRAYLSPDHQGHLGSSLSPQRQTTQWITDSGQMEHGSEVGVFMIRKALQNSRATGPLSPGHPSSW